jgi:glycosyltransferase involved in cell wall biosynthesis
LPARLLEAIDRRALRAADLVVADTAAHAAYFAAAAGLSRDGIAVCFVGAEERLFHPGPERDPAFTCLFVGKLIPLHGVETVLEAARIASDVRFRIVGSGQLQALLRRRPANVEWVPWIAYERLPVEFRRAGCALGIFGTSAKSARVIPNKAFQALACGTPLITADTPPAHELLTEGVSALLVPPGDPRSLAGAVQRLAGDPDFARALGAGGLAAYRERASEEVLGRRWRGLLEGLVGLSSRR